MDSFFKAAVCDLDKLLDDFELSSEEHECRSVFLKPPSYPFSSAPPLEAPAAPPEPPDLNSLHYGSAAGCLDNNGGGGEQEARSQPLTAVDLLSSVERGSARSPAPPCPDRALKPVCDLVNDTGSVVLLRADSHDAFGELDTAERELQEEEEKVEEKEEEGGEALLVDFDSPLVELKDVAAEEAGGGGVDCERVGGYSASLSLLDVILPAAVAETAPDPPPSSSQAADGDAEEPRGAAAAEEEKEEPVMEEAGSEGSATAAAGGPTGLSCLPMAVSMCGALVGQAAEQPEEEQEREEEGAEAEAELHDSAEAEEEAAKSEGGRESPEGQHASPEPAAAAAAIAIAGPPSPEPSPLDPPEFGFEYLPESDQAELLVTDEELDAFLQAHAEAEQAAAYRAAAEEPRRCGQEEPGGAAAPESGAAEGRLSPAPSARAEDARQEEADATSEGHRSDRQPSYGGARPKQPHCQAARSPPSGEEEREGEEGEEPASSKEPTAAEEEEEEEGEESACSAQMEEAPPAACPAYTSQDQAEYGAGCEELSEPPPYPGETSPPDGGWRREGPEEVGSRQPAWVPDAEAPNCMNCYQRFTFTKRRHHCRACGKVYCAVCCNRKCKLKYLEKEARVCVLCFDSIHRAQALERMMSPTGPSPNPNVPSEYCSTIPPMQQARAAGTLNSPPPTVMVPVSVLKQPSSDGGPREQKRVWFADGILPNGEVADTSRLAGGARRSSQEIAAPPDTTAPGSAGSEVSGSLTPEASGSAEVARPPVSGPWDYALLSGLGSEVKRLPSLLPDNEDELPPLLITTGDDLAGDVLVEESPAPCQIRHLLEEGGPRPLTFVLNSNLLVNVKLVTCCGRQCWCFGTSGLQALGQKELVFLLECLPEEKTLPRDLFTFCLSVYQDAQRGKFLEELDNVTFTSSFLGSKDHAGMLFFSHSCQPLEGLALPPQPFLFALLIQKLEVPWAKVFPLRLLLRLGAEYNVYPTPLVSVRFRESVYRETGHTIMNLLADLRNYQYSLASVEGLRIHMEMGHSYIDIPKSSFSEMQKVVNAANEHVISIGASFSAQADSHLVCFQNEEGSYQTQANSMPGKTRTVTGASFVVFNGALKASSGFIAKSSIVEDGLMVQIPPETMESLRSALREQTDFHIPCGRTDGGEVRENVSVRWVDWTAPLNTGRSSSVDGRPLDGVGSVRLQQDAEFESDGRIIRCTEVFYQLKSEGSSLASVLPSCGVFQKEMALAACSALTPHLGVLAASRINSLALRVSTQADMVEYQAGSGGRLLPQRYMNELDSALIPVIHGGGASVPQTAMDMEFLFYITHTI